MNLSEKIMQFKEKKVKICTSHKIYGDQEIFIRSFTPIYDENRVGFKYNTREIYIDFDTLEEWECNDTTIKINGKLMSFSIAML